MLATLTATALKSLDKIREIFLDKSLDIVKGLQTNGFYQFSGFRLDTKKRRLLKGDDVVSLTPKEFDVLLFLVERAGSVVEKAQLLDAIWADVFVEETTLARNVSWLRQKLAAESGGAKFIETVPKRGYRFAADVTIAPESDADLIVEEKTLHRIRIEETTSITDLENAPSPPLAPIETLALTDGAQNQRSKIKNSKILLFAFGIVTIAAIGFAVYQIYLRRHEPKTILVSRVAPFSGLPGREDMPAFSSDGRQLVFAWNGGEDGDNLDVYVKIIGAGEPVRLTTDRRDDVYPRFSPDNRFVAFVRNLKEEGGEVLLIPALGGAERRICKLFSGNYSLSFSPDGQRLAVIDADSNKPDQFAVHTVNLQTGEKRRVTQPGEFTGETTPRFSPDGASIAFVRIAPGGEQDLFVVPASGGAARQITFDGKTIHSLAWSADGQNLIFNSFRGSDSTNLWRVAATGSEPEMLAAGSRAMTNLTVSPDGKTIAFVETEKVKASIWRVAAGEQPQKFIYSVGANLSPQFSPDGRTVAFMSDRTGVYEIWLADAEDGKNPRQLTFAGNPASSPRFSPDGKFIAYQAQSEQRTDIFIVSTEVGEPRRLTKEGEKNILPSWSANGDWIFFTSNRTGENQLWKMPAGGGEAVQITKHGALQAQPAPDGKTIYYSKEKTSGLWRVPTAGGEESAVTELSEAGAVNSWAVTSTGIYFIARPEQPPYKPMFYDFSTARTKEIAGTDKLPPPEFIGFTASPDGKTILFARFDRRASSIILAEIAE